MSDDDKLFIHDRWQQLVRLLKPGSVTSVGELSDALRVSKATVRRDLGELDSAGRLRRVRGGAIPADARSASIVAPPLGHLHGQAGFDDSAVENARLKRRIGARAAELLVRDEAIIIDGGSTTLELARHIGSDPMIVLTTSVPILFALLGRPELRVLITGGEVFREQNIVLNPYGDGIVSNYEASRIFIGAQAVSRRGLMQTDPLLVQNEKSLIASADEVVVLADSSKFTARGSLVVCGLDRITTLVTDTGIPDEMRDALAANDVELIVVDD